MQVYYFTRSGKSARIAEQIAQAKGLVSNKIADNRNWAGPLNFALAGAAAAKKEIIDINYPPLNDSQPLILVFPLWAGTMPPAIRSFLAENEQQQIIAVINSAKGSLKASEKALFYQSYEIKGRQENAPHELLQD